MPVFPPYFDGLIEARVDMTNPNGQHCNWVMFFHNTNLSRGFPTAAVDLSGHIIAWVTDMLPDLSDGMQFDQVVMLDRSEADGAIHIEAIGLNGADATHAMPPQTALVVTWGTGRSGRRYRGRTYLTGFVEADNDATGVPTAAICTAFTGYAEDFLVALGGDDFELVILSRGGPTVHKTGEPTVWSPFHTNVITASIDTRWDTQRRRRPN